MAAGDSLVLPAQVVDYLARLRALGMSERIIGIERDGWILLAAHAPRQVTAWGDLAAAMLAYMARLDPAADQMGPDPTDPDQAATALDMAVLTLIESRTTGASPA